MQGIDSDLIRGHIDTIILKILSSGDKYGFEICKEVEERSSGLYELKQPTLYSCLKRLESQKLISSYWEDSDIGGKRHYYKLTDLGKQTYQKNQEDWSRSRQIIDNLIENGDISPISFAAENRPQDAESEQKIQSLQEEIESLKEKLKEQAENPTVVYKEKIVEVEKAAPQVQENQDDTFTSSDLKVEDDTDFMPWSSQEQENNTSSSDEYKTAQIEEDGEKVIVDYAPNGEILSVEKSDDQPEFISEDEAALEDEINNENNENESSPAQASVFDTEEKVFDEDESDNNSQEVDIMELLGHTPKQQVEYQKDEEQIKNPIVPIEEAQEEVKPFNFNIDDFVVKSKESYFASSEDVDSNYQYLTPEEKIEGTNQEQDSAPFDFEKFRKEKIGEEEKSEDKQSQDQTDEDSIYQTPVYHTFETITPKYEENDEEKQVSSADDLYINPESETSEDDGLKLFSDDIFEQNDLQSSSNDEEIDESSISTNSDEINIQDLSTDDETNSQNNQKDFMDFYKSTSNYNNLHPTFTEEEYKEKLSSLMTYTTNTSASDDNKNNASAYEFNKLTTPKDFSQLTLDFEREGIKVKPHTKLVKEAKSSRSYIESNKLNCINSWTSFGFVAFITLLTYLIMHAYNSNISAQIFLVGIACLAVIPVIYSIIYFINPYKKKAAKYAARVYMLFAILITIQLLIITYCINLQLGFYSFSQPEYEHLYWIVPSLLSIYPITDAVFHNIYFSSKNFHV